MRRRQPITPPSGSPPADRCGTFGGAVPPIPETSRMRSRHPLPRPTRLVALGAILGKPAPPRAAGLAPAARKKAEDSLTAEEVVKALRLDEATLAEGSRLYRQECLHCHGLEGNGRGPTGYWVNPPPRDYRS